MDRGPGPAGAIQGFGPAGTGGDASPRLEALQSIPQRVVYGDNIAQNTRWPTIRANGIRLAESTRTAGGSVGVVDLPEHGIKGDSHMMDRTSDQVAGVVQAWLASKALWS